MTVMNDIPFSIPPYFAILGRAIVTLEGVALTGDEDYGMIMESYPFIARKLLKEDRPEIQRALQEVLYSGNDTSGGLKFTRLIALLNNAAGSVEKKEGGVFVDLDAVPDDGLAFEDGLRYLMSDEAESLRNLLESEVDNLVDVISRQIIRKGFNEALIALTPPRPPAIPFFGDLLPPTPKVDEIPLPILLPGKDGSASTPSVGILSLKDFVDLAAPKLDQDDEIYALSVSDAAGDILGPNIASFLRGDSVLSVKTVQLLLKSAQSGMFGKLNDNEVVSQVFDVVGRLADQLDASSGDDRDQISNITSALNDEERRKFDEIMSKIIERTIARTTDRLADTPRIV